MGDAGLVQQGDRAEQEKQKAALNAEILATNAQFDLAMAKRSKLMALMTDINQNSHFQNKLRYIFL